VAQLFPRLQTSQEERAAMVAILLDSLGDKSRIVKTFAMQVLADLAEQDARLRPEVMRMPKVQTRMGSPAMESRGRSCSGGSQPTVRPWKRDEGSLSPAACEPMASTGVGVVSHA
jgi:hypothetical protein